MAARSRIVTKAELIDPQVNMSAREIVGYASTFGNVDSYGDMVMPGAFTKTLAEQMPKGLIGYFWWHDYPIGVLSKAEQNATGLLTVGRIVNTRDGDEALEMVKAGVAQYMSFAGEIIDSGKSKALDGSVVRELRQIRLREVGPCPWPVNESAQILAVKSRLWGKGARKAVEDVADVARCLDMLQSALRNGPPLSADEQVLLKSILHEVGESRDSLAALLAEPSSTPKAPGPDTQGETGVDLVALLDAVRSRNANLIRNRA
jgi:HK97 family phage prohead protease